METKSFTPRTDEVFRASRNLPYGSMVEIPKDYPPCDPWALSRELELELNAMKSKIRYEKAVTMARNAHDGQCRKYTGEPYITHPFAVAGLVASAVLDDDMIIAALLHDTIEDTFITAEMIEESFGVRVRDLVLDVTDISKKSDGNRAVRKAIDREHNAKASPEAKTIKLADLIDNIKCIQGQDENFARKYMAEKRELLKVLTEGDEYLFRVVTNILDDYCCKKG